MKGLTLDAGALIGFERNERRPVTVMQWMVEQKLPMVIPAGVVAQVWRNPTRQARLARLFAMPQVEIEALDDARARAAGLLCGHCGTHDIVDASVVLCARRRGYTILSADLDDLRRLDPKALILRV